jgi:hypothetical protein
MTLFFITPPPGLSRIAGWCVIGAPPRGQPRTPAMMLPPGCEGRRVRRMTVWWTFRRPFMGRPVPRPFMRNALLDLTTIVPATAYHRISYDERYSRFKTLESNMSLARCLAVPPRAHVRSVVWHGGTARRAVEKAVDMSYTLRLWHVASRSGVATTASLREWTFGLRRL